MSFAGALQEGGEQRGNKKGGKPEQRRTETKRGHNPVISDCANKQLEKTDAPASPLISTTQSDVWSLSFVPHISCFILVFFFYVFLMSNP